MKLHYPKNILSYRYSRDEFDNGELPFAPMTFMTKSSDCGDGVELLIGYLECGAGVFIKDRQISEVRDKGVVDAYKISKQGLKDYYKKSIRPTGDHSIFRKPKLGDTLMCISKRYQGCEFGETHVLKAIRDDRLAFSVDSEYTYESKYFIVVDTASITMYVNTDVQPLIALDSSGSITLTGNSTIFPGKSISVLSLPSNVKDASDLFAQRKIQERSLIRRPVLEDEEIVQRKYHVPEKIQRSK